ncbi:outer membrane protein transport protein [Sagittula sp. NFXS13]|uniref:OmpP1/FadL family transporter n=1 Tax=Sagittula sp. NFXS13 TaxID=2819095 RepID=UPI0032DFB5E2
MKTFTTGATVLALSATTAMAAGLDRSGQSVAAIFSPGGTTTLSYGIVMPEVSGEDIAGGGSYDSVAEDYGQFGVSYTYDINDKASFALIIDNPYGADISYDSSPFTTRLGGTSADFNSVALTGVARYKFSDRFSVFGGVSAERLDATVALNGVGYATAINLAGTARAIGVDAGTLGAALQGDPAAAGALAPTILALPTSTGNLATDLGNIGASVQANAGQFLANGGYNFKMDKSTQPHYLIGAAYEIPDIAMRISGTYHFETKHKADTTETIYSPMAGSLVTVNDEVDFVTPQSFNLEAQTGIAAGTLLTATWRWTDFSAVDLVPTALGSDLVNLDDSNRYTLGVARQFSDKLAGSLTFSYEPEGDDLVSPLGPTNGLKGISLGGRWTDGPLNISGGINYSVLGDAKAEVGGVAQAEMTDNHVVGIGFKLDMNF